MKKYLIKYLPIFLFLIALLISIQSFSTPFRKTHSYAPLKNVELPKDAPSPESPGFDIQAFGRIPIQSGGRIKPIDSLARNSLLALRGKQYLALPDGSSLSATAWLIELMMRPEQADNYPVFRIEHLEIMDALGRPHSDGKYCSFNDLSPYFPLIDQQAKNAPSEASLQTALEKQFVHLAESLTLYHELLHTIHPMGDLDKIQLEYAAWISSIQPGLQGIRDTKRPDDTTSEALKLFLGFADYYLKVSQISKVGIVPSEDGSGRWNNIGQCLLDAIITGKIDPIALAYSDLVTAYRQGNSSLFNQKVEAIHHYFDQEQSLAHENYIPKVYYEACLNAIQPFLLCIKLYIFAFILIGFSWLWFPKELGRTGFWITLLAFLIHTWAIGSRIYLQGRPPVTNLYSSAIFIGWASVLIGIFFERFFKNTLGTAISSLIGFLTLIIAHHLSFGGDTLEMLRAVLDSNFWLSTHVIVVSMGYSAMFLAGSLGVFYVLLQWINLPLQRQIAPSIAKMGYGIVCFATLFSFVGTMLGGIWADQSWGRFWGWDPKENGAIMIVIWCAILLHARWGKLVQDRGFIALMIFGNIVTAWSWFGTNMLAVGLHSYGFIEAAFFWLLAFILSQILIIALGNIKHTPQ